MGPQLKVVERTRTATMLCAASGNPDPEITWFKDFLPVDINGSSGRIKQLRSGKANYVQRTPAQKPHEYTYAHVNTSILKCDNGNNINIFKVTLYPLESLQHATCSLLD